MQSIQDVYQAIKGCPAIRIAVAQPADSVVLSAICQATALGIAEFILVGDMAETRQLACEAGEDLSGFTLVDIPDDIEAAEYAVRLVHDGEADVLMKGLLQSADFLRAVLNKDYGLRKKGSIISSIAVIESSRYHKLLFLTDIAFSPVPDLETKKALIRNAVEIVGKFGVNTPKVACLAAAEEINPKIPSSLEAEQLKQANEAGELKNCIVEGPISLDLAISKESALHKGYDSPVAGDADILLVPDITTGNSIYKALACLSDMQTGGVMAGAASPIVFCSRADNVETKLNTLAFACYLSHNQITGGFHV